MPRVPAQPGQLILDEVAMRTCPLLSTRDFLQFCEQRNLRVSLTLLQWFEQTRLIAPIVRITKPVDDDRVLHLDGESTEPYFLDGWLADCGAPGAEYAIPTDHNDPQAMAFYSEFQIWTLERVLRETTLSYQLDEFAGPDSAAVDWYDRLESLRRRTDNSVARLRSDAALNVAPILCQMISNRYLPPALGNERRIQINTTTQSGQWLSFSSSSWEWDDYCRAWDPSVLVNLFTPDEKSLENMHWRMVSAMSSCDPLWEWRNLIQFVNQQKCNKLRGDALRAETYRQCTEMLRYLHRDLYGVDLGPPQDALHDSPSGIPEASVRENPRERLQYVVNQYDLNPQPKAVLLVEGETEVVLTQMVFRGLFGLHHGVAGIEILNLHGVDNATGNRRSDRFDAMFRLVDYLLEHQSLVFLILDNEGQARNLKAAAETKRSVFGNRRWAIAPERIHVWERNFEWDNCSDDQLARAMTAVAQESAQFTAADIERVRAGSTAESLTDLCCRRSERDPQKPLLGRALADLVIESSTRSSASERPIVESLLQVRQEASRNPLPVTEEIWGGNQRFLDSEARTDHG